MDSFPQTRQSSSPQGLLPMPWDQWPAEARLMLGLVALWSLLGLLVLSSASWWVADREMGDAAYYIKRHRWYNYIHSYITNNFFYNSFKNL